MTVVRPDRVVASRWLFVMIVATMFAVAPSLAQVCGNAVVEAGEKCDDGSSQNGGANSCCGSDCQFSGESPDVIVGELVGTVHYGPVGSIHAYAIGTTSCNLGTCWLNWISSTPEHPVIGQNMFRLKDGRFEQIGQAWLKHGFTALTGSVCASCIPPPNGSHLGVNCSDPYDSNLNGSQTRLGPKNDVNPNTGIFLFPDARESTTGDAIYKRLQVHDVDLNPSLNVGALYFVEGQYVTRDDAEAKNNPNNASYRPVTVGAAPGYALTLTGSTQRGKLGIQAWKAADAAVTESTVSAPEGMFVLSAKATALGGGIYHYEYALQNMTNNRGAQAFSVPLPPGTIVTNVGFHDVDYHSSIPAELYNGTDWTGTVSASSVTWATTTYAVNPMANALRWGTLYNFRFDANVAPGFVPVGIELFKPGSPTSATTTTVGPNPCIGAANGTGCTDLNACTLSDSCQSGVCQSSGSVTCSPSDLCHTAGTCAPATGLCSNPNAPNGTTCLDGNACTQTDVCQSGVCLGSNPVVCTASDQCHNAGTCAPATGVCSNPAKANGSACNDANLCTQTDSCQSGACAGTNPVVCTPSNACHLAGTCSPSTGNCSNPAAPDGTGCNDVNACTTTDVCVTGACTGTNPVVCTASDVCHAAGTCSPGTGICSNPAGPNGITCDDGNNCTTDDACSSGACVGNGVPSPIEVDDGVHVAQVDGITTITWNVASGSTWSHVLRGLVSGLPVGPGGGDETCLASGTVDTSATDPDTPNPDEAFWYLVSGANACGNGPYGFAIENGVPTPRASATCP